MTLVYLLVAWFTDGDLFAIKHTKDLIEADWLPFLRELAEMANVMHHDLRLLIGFSTDTTGFSQFGACSHSGRQNEHVHIGLTPSLKGFPVLGPVLIEKETDFSVSFPILSCYFDAEILAKASEYLSDRGFVFTRQSFGEREAENMLNSGEVAPVINEAIVVLNAAIDGAVKSNNLIFIEPGPRGFGERRAIRGAKALASKLLDELVNRSFHHRFPSSGSAFKRPFPSVGSQDDFGDASIANRQHGAEKVCFLGANVGNAGLFLTSTQLECVKEKILDLSLEVFGEAFRSTDTTDPVISVSQEFDPDEFRVFFHRCWQCSHLLDEFPKFLRLGLFAGYQLSFS